MFTPDDENGFSYFLKYDLLTDVVVCPGMKFPCLKDSCYVDIRKEARLNENQEITHEENYSCPNCGTQLVKKKGSIKPTRR